MAFECAPPNVSVIIPAFNEAERGLEQTVEDMLIGLDVYPLSELIVVDDASYVRDNTVIMKNEQYLLETLEEKFTLKDNRIKFIKLLTNVGTYEAKNMGIHMSSGVFLTFQDADDISHRHRILYQYFMLHFHEPWFTSYVNTLKSHYDSSIEFNSTYVGSYNNGIIRQRHFVLEQQFDVCYCGHKKREVTKIEKFPQTKFDVQIIPAEISLFIKKQLFQDYLGEFQQVRFAADTEIRKRIYLLNFNVCSYILPLYSCLDKYMSIEPKHYSLTRSIHFGLQSKLRKVYADFFNKYHENINILKKQNNIQYQTYLNYSKHDVSENLAKMLLQCLHDEYKDDHPNELEITIKQLLP